MWDAVPASHEPQQEMASMHKKILNSFRAGVAIWIFFLIIAWGAQSGGKLLYKYSLRIYESGKTAVFPGEISGTIVK